MNYSCACGRFVWDFACTYVRACPRPHLILRFGDGFQNHAQNHARENFKNDGKNCFMNYGMWLWPFCTGFCMHLCTNMSATSPYAHIWRWLSKLYSKSCARDFFKMMAKIVSCITVCGCGRFVRDFACSYVRTCPRHHLMLKSMIKCKFRHQCMVFGPVQGLAFRVCVYCLYLRF